jgi:hypothetical protein
MTNPVLAELIDDGAGRLTYRGARYLQIRPETLAALQRALEGAVGAGAAMELEESPMIRGGSARTPEDVAARS